MKTKKKTLNTDPIRENRGVCLSASALILLPVNSPLPSPSKLPTCVYRSQFQSPSLHLLVNLYQCSQSIRVCSPGIALSCLCWYSSACLSVSVAVIRSPALCLSLSVGCCVFVFLSVSLFLCICSSVRGLFLMLFYRSVFLFVCLYFHLPLRCPLSQSVSHFVSVCLYVSYFACFCAT